MSIVYKEKTRVTARDTRAKRPPRPYRRPRRLEPAAPVAVDDPFGLQHDDILSTPTPTPPAPPASPRTPTDDDFNKTSTPMSQTPTRASDKTPKTGSQFTRPPCGPSRERKQEGSEWLN